jgi:hypothetical protein
MLLACFGSRHASATVWSLLSHCGCLADLTLSAHRGSCVVVTTAKRDRVLSPTQCCTATCSNSQSQKQHQPPSDSASMCIECIWGLCMRC